MHIGQWCTTFFGQGPLNSFLNLDTNSKMVHTDTNSKVVHTYNFYSIRMILPKGQGKNHLSCDFVNHVSAGFKSKSKSLQQGVGIAHFIHCLLTFQSKLSMKPGH